MRHDELVTAVFNNLNVSAVTTKLSSAYAPLPAIFAADAPQVADAQVTGNFPFVSFLIVSDQGLATNEKFGMDALVQVDVWHRTPSMKALAVVSRAIFEALNRVAMPDVTGHIETRVEDASYSTEPDGKTKRATLEFRVTSLPL